MSGDIEERFEFPNGTVIQALDYECGYEFNPKTIYKKDKKPHAFQMDEFKVKGFIIVSLEDYINIKNGIDKKFEVGSELHASFSFKSDHFNLIQNIIGIEITSLKIVKQPALNSDPWQLVNVHFIARDLKEDL